MVMTGVIVPLLYALVCVAAVRFLRFFHLTNIPRHYLIGAFLLKLLAGLVFFLVYTRYYTDTSTSDALRYFNDSQIIYHEWFQHRDVFWTLMKGEESSNPAYLEVINQLEAWSSGYTYGLSDDCSTIIRINVVISFISFGSFHVHAILLTFFSFIGFTAIFKAFVSFFLGKEKWLFAISFLLPSVVFWTSSVLKESALFFFLGMMLLHMIKLLTDSRLVFSWFMMVVCFVILFYLKMYVIVSMLPAFLFLMVARSLKTISPLLIFLAVHILCFVLAQNAHHFFTGGDFLYVLHKRQTDFYNVAYLSQAGSVIDIPPIGTVWQFILHFPQAFFLTYFRPMPFEVLTVPGICFGFENLIYFIIFVMTWVKRKKSFTNNEWIILLFLMSFVLVFASILGNCVPILGAILRYKIVALPFLLIVLAMIIDKNKLPLKLRKIL